MSDKTYEQEVEELVRDESSRFKQTFDGRG